MTTHDELRTFIRDALAAGRSRGEIEGVLAGAGWPRDLIGDGLAAFADVDFPVPVPRPRPYLSAQEAFLYLMLFSALYVTAFNVGTLLFQYIDRAFPDPADPFEIRSFRSAVRWSISSLIVAFPVFLYVSRLINRALRLDPVKRASKIRRWLTYLTLFIAGVVLTGDGIALVYRLLGGELTVRFVLKVVTIGGIAGAIFLYYLSDLSLDEKDAGA
jgi:hypothetical protein